MKIYSWNVNGIRAVERKEELEKFITTYDPDIFFLQETKAKPEQLKSIIEKYSDYEHFYHAAKKPGYAGTGVWVKKNLSPFNFNVGMPDFNDTEGRIARLSLPNQNLELIGVYFPNGGKSPAAWDDKLVFYAKFLQFVNQLRAEGKNVIWCGDVNCAHNEIDLARSKSNQNSIGFLPEERAWITKCIESNWVDVWRETYPEKVIYSWWHLISRARSRNVGWRIDYFFCDRDFFPQIQRTDYLNDQMGSDHCPVLIEW